MSKISLISQQYQTAYYLATAAAALTGDDVFEVKSDSGVGFATGQALNEIIRLQQDFPLVQIIKSAIKIV